MPNFNLKVKSRKRIFDDTKDGVVYEVKLQRKHGKASDAIYNQVDVTLKNGDRTLYDQFLDGETVRVSINPADHKLTEYADHEVAKEEPPA